MSRAKAEGRSEEGTEKELPTETPPGPDGLPILGNTFQFIGDIREFFEERLAPHGDVVSYSVAGMDFVTVLHPDPIERVLLTDYESYEKWSFEEFGGEFAEEGVLLTDGKQWRRQRRLMQDAFTIERIRGYQTTMTDFADELARSWDDGEEVVLDESMSDFTLRVLAHTLFDVDIEGADHVVTDFANTMNERMDARNLTAFLPMWVPTPGNRRYKRRLEDVRSFIDDLIDNRRGHAEEYDDLLSMLLAAEGEDGETLSEAELRDNMVTFLFAGHETTSLALTYTLLSIATNPEVRERLDEEHETVLGGDAPTFADLPQLEYTERVIKESLRLYPPAFVLFRKAATDTELGGYRIPEGTRITVPQFRLHTDERFYDDPKTFRPDRWSDGFEDELPDYAYFPFGGGPRHCIGMRFAMMELRSVLPVLTQHLDFELLSDPDPDFHMGATLQPTEPVRVRVSRRS